MIFYHATSYVLLQQFMSFFIKQNMNFNFHPHSTLYFFFFTEVVLLKVVRHLKIHQHTKFHGPTSTGSSFASSSEVWTSAIF
jgi:hypothetical protein